MNNPMFIYPKKGPPQQFIGHSDTLDYLVATLECAWYHVVFSLAGWSCVVSPKLPG
jgi:hypothetical protein